MSNFVIFGIVVVLWAALGIKMVLDQVSLLKLYRQKADPSYPPLPGEEGSKGRPLFSSQAPAAKRGLGVMFAKHPGYPEIDKLARKVRIEYFSLLGLMVVIGISFFLLGP